jgi:hypothetical protein
VNGVVALMMYLLNPIAGARSAASRWGADHVLHVHPAIQELDRLDVRVGVRGADRGVVVFLGKEPRCRQHDARQLLVAMKQLAEVLGGGFRDTVDVLRDRRDVLGDPRRAAHQPPGINASPKTLVVLV